VGERGKVGGGDEPSRPPSDYRNGNGASKIAGWAAPRFGSGFLAWLRGVLVVVWCKPVQQKTGQHHCDCKPST
jgi:hypothetical protein